MQSGLSGVRPGTERSFRLLFLLAALYDGLLGAAFLVGAGPILTWLAVPSPASPIYLQLIAGLIVVQGLGYFFVWRRLWRNVDIVTMGIAAKLALVAVTAASVVRGDLPHPLVAWLAVIDACFLIGFLLFLRTASEVRYQTQTSARAGRALDPTRHWTRDG